MNSRFLRIVGHMNRTRLLIILALLLFIVAATAAILLQRSPQPRERDAPAAQPPAVQTTPAEGPAVPEADVRRLPEREQLARAFEAAFGRRVSARVEVEDDEDGHAGLVEFTPGGLLWTSFGPVLISEGQAVDAAHATAGRLAVHYLEPAGGAFRVAHSIIPAVTTGSFGHIGSWQVRGDLASFPVLQAEGGGTWQGYTCSYVTLVELKPDGVATLANFPSYYSNAGAVVRGRPNEIEGKLTNIVKNRSFDVAYSGSRSFVEHYERRGDSYARGSGKTRMQEC